MTSAEQSSLHSVRARDGADRTKAPTVVRNNAPVPLEPELEHLVLAIAAHTGHSRAEVIAECVRDRLKGGTFAAPRVPQQFPPGESRREDSEVGSSKPKSIC